MTKLSRMIYFLISIIFFICFDLFFSNYFLNISSFPQNPIFDLVYVENTGAAFSLLQDSKIFLICFAAFAFIWIIIYTFKNIEKYSIFSIFCCSILISGIFCNLYERISLGYVRDFFKLNFVDFPVFNISDIFINIAVIAIVIIIIKHNFSKNNETDNR